MAIFEAPVYVSAVITFPGPGQPGPVVDSILQEAADDWETDQGTVRIHAIREERLTAVFDLFRSKGIEFTAHYGSGMDRSNHEQFCTT